MSIAWRRSFNRFEIHMYPINTGERMVATPPQRKCYIQDDTRIALDDVVWHNVLQLDGLYEEWGLRAIATARERFARFLTRGHAALYLILDERRMITVTRIR